MNVPFVSCICPTYGRFPNYGHLLEESVQSFLVQDYPANRRELVIVNDCPQQVLTCDAPGVRILNLMFRHETLGAKYNAGCELSGGSYILPWEDDDISLPWRLSRSVPMMMQGDHWNPQYSWFMNSEGLHNDHKHGVCHNASVFSRAAWRAVNGYPKESGKQDAMMDTRLKRLNTNVFSPLTNIKDWFYIYRWSVSPCHVSGSHNPNQFYKDWGNKPVQEGTFKINPHWQQDYVALTRKHI